ncbi:MAG: hypothetical protein KME64_08135 [Scytonematopsis contorta HA4267-MV1]|jgi:hypothetical protein|nr:hypothetical protein [Scytonematopsis contorta HA4267-MV1]
MSNYPLQEFAYPLGESNLFTEKEFDQIFNFSTINQTVEDCCRIATQNPKAFYLFMQRYTHFNGAAGPLVARLASSIGLSRDLFKDKNCNVLDEADRGLKVAARVISATIEEHSDKRYKGFTHRNLAQATLKAVADYASLSVSERNEFAKIPDWLTSLLTDAVSAYEGVPGNLEELIKAMGFHAASEMLADSEYTVIDKVVRHEKSGTGFDKYLKDVHGKVELDGKQFSAWYWIAIHGSFQESGVEKEHYKAALEALDLAVQYSPYPQEKTRSLVFEGFRIFVQIQQALFQELRQECLQVLKQEEKSLIA